MSNVTDIIMMTGLEDDSQGGHWTEIYHWFDCKELKPIAALDKYFSGNKKPQFKVAGGSYNYFPIEDFLAYVDSLNWTESGLHLVLHTESGEFITRTVHE